MNKMEIMLLMRFESPIVPLEKICNEYFGFSKSIAKRRARSGTLPVPAFRLGSSQKLPWMVNIHDLAKFIEYQSKEAKSEWVTHDDH